MNTAAKIRLILKLLFGVLLTLVFSGDAQGDLETLWRCREKFSALNRTIAPVNLSGPARRSGRYAGAEAILAKQKIELNPEQYEAFERWYFDHFFSDRWEAFADSAEATGVELQHTSRYSKEGEDPLDGYRTARDYLWKVPLDKITPETLAKTQEHLLSWRSTRQAKAGWLSWMGASNSEHTKTADLGQIRNRPVKFQVTKTGGYTKGPDLSDLHEINPFLFYRPGKSFLAQDNVFYMPLSEWREFADQLSPELVKRLLQAEKTEKALSPEGLVEEQKTLDERLAREEDHVRWLSEVEATKLLRANKLSQAQFEERLKENERLHREEYQKIKEAQLSKLEWRRRHLDGLEHQTFKELRTDFTKEMVNRRWEKLHQELANARTEGAIVAAIASFHYDFISIHPFMNGNGRTGRLITERLLAEYDLPPPIWEDFGNDVAVRKTEFTKGFVRALAISKEFHRDLGAVIDNKIPHTAVGLGFLAPVVTRQVAAENPIDAMEFLTWAAAGQSHYLNVEGSLFGYRTWRQHADERNIHLANPLFVASFGRLSPTDRLFQKKLVTDYDSKLVYRTIKDNLEVSDPSLLAYFNEPVPTNTQKMMNEFNRVVLRDLDKTRQWVKRPWWGPDPANKAGMVRLYTSPEKSQNAHEGKGGTTFQVEALLRKPGTLAPTTNPTIIFHAVGIDPEVIQKVTGVSGKKSSVAQRESFNRVRIEGFEGDVRTNTRTYELSSDGIWFQTGLSR